MEWSWLLLSSNLNAGNPKSNGNEEPERGCVRDTSRSASQTILSLHHREKLLS
jgi:hypothetical protein